MAFIILLLVCVFFSASLGYNVGTGIYDITGPAAELGMMGYAAPKQITHGILNRLRARSFIIQDPDTSTDLVIVNVDLCMIFSEVKTAALEILCSQLEKSGISTCPYKEENVMISAIHTHAGPAGFTYFPLYNVNSIGFQKANFDVIANGIAQSILRAHFNLSTDNKASLSVIQDKLEGSNINRSPTSYLSNPLSERSQYSDGDTDKDITLVRIDGADQPIGLISWFSVHGTALNNTNTLISGDNKGYAAYLFEKKMNNNALPGTPGFLAGFFQTNEGDVSPNTRGATCPDGTPCDGPTSTCNGFNEGCTGKGPGATDKESCEIIAKNQMKKADDLFNSPNLKSLTGKLGFVHTYLDMSAQTVGPSFTSTGEQASTCKGALGVSFAAGTTDGPGEFNFVQHSNTSNANPFWRAISQVLHAPTKEQLKCQYPKPILLDTQSIPFPIQWTASILPLQIFRIGSMFIVAVPGEFTTMSGRRLRQTVYDAVLPSFTNSTEKPIVVIAGLANAYSHYITTFEEYSNQRYEGASTLFGPHTLAAYQQNYAALAKALSTGNLSLVPQSVKLPDYSRGALSFQPGVVLDTVPLGKKFGDVKQNVRGIYTVGEMASAEFWGADPRNDLRTEDTFLTVEVEDSSVPGGWSVVLNDGDWETEYHWRRHGVSDSIITVRWYIPNGFNGNDRTFRLCHFGNHRNLLSQVQEYNGCSSSFTIASERTFSSTI